MTKEADQFGFTLIELLFVVAIIGILATIGISSYLGMQEKSRKSALMRTATASIPEIQVWLQSSKGDRNAIEVDTNGDGSVVQSGPNADMTNKQLDEHGVNVVFAAAKRNLLERSPWDSNVDLWWSVDPHATDSYGYIVLTSTTMGISLRAFTKNEPTAIINKLIFSE